MRFLNSVTVPKNVKGEILWDFLTSIVLQNIETNEGETLWWNPKNFKKSRIVPKKIRVKNTKGGPMFSRFWTSMFLFWTSFWRFEYVLDVRSSSWLCWTNEQKSGPIALNWRKKTNHCKSRDFLRKRRLKRQRVDPSKRAFVTKGQKDLLRETRVFQKVAQCQK